MSGQTANLRARCEPELAERVEALARKWKMKSSDIVRIAIEDYLAARENTPNPLRSPAMSTEVMRMMLGHSDNRLNESTPIYQPNSNPPRP